MKGEAGEDTPTGLSSCQGEGSGGVLCVHQVVYEQLAGGAAPLQVRWWAAVPECNDGMNPSTSPLHVVGVVHGICQLQVSSGTLRPGQGGGTWLTCIPGQSGGS